MIKLRKVLIANRGEIACRIMRTAKRLGMATVAVYSDADRRALHTAQADESVHIGPSPAPESYLRIDAIIAAAKATGSDCIHPGYGFLAENPDLAEACIAAGLKFVGPSPDAMRRLGGKAAAKDIAIKAGVPVVPGYQGGKQDYATLAREARRIGYPLMIKAVAGGGGRGMRLVPAENDLASLLESAQREAQGAFGNPDVLLERQVQRPRHIEVQVFGDSHGNVVHLFERDCTLQRRNQKVIEEAPAPGMTADLRAKMCAAAVKLAAAVGYEGAGTVEFLVEGGRLTVDAPWYFIEMNTRLQVEHPVTEAITGLDLVEWQFRVAAGERLPLPQSEISMHGHAIEARVCAEDPGKDFMPSIGRIAVFSTPPQPDLRVETGIFSGDEVSPYYDSMVAKLIANAPDRQGALSGLRSALQGTRLLGLKSNIAFLHALASNESVSSQEMDTGLIGREISTLSKGAGDARAVEVGTRLLLEARNPATGGVDPWSRADAFQLGGTRAMQIAILVDGQPRRAEASWPHGELVVTADGTEAARLNRAQPADEVLASLEATGAPTATAQVFDLMQSASIAWPIYDLDSAEDGTSGASIRAPINGKVAKVFVSAGDTIDKGARIAIVEAMKMEHVLSAPRAGTVAKVNVSEGQQVTANAVIAALADE